MTCQRCGRPSQGTLCRDCERDESDVDPGLDRQLACPTNAGRDREKIDIDDPRVTADRLCSHCFPDGEIPADAEYLLQARYHANGFHLPMSYDGKRCKFGEYADYTSYKRLLVEMSVEEFDRRLNGGPD